jgi:tRNA(Ile)-lysidine synthase
LEDYLDCPGGAIFLSAVSGGADSMAMLAALCVVVPKDRIFCLHVEHGLRPAEESKGDAEHVSAFCKKNKIKCFVESIPPGDIEAFAKSKGTGIEAAARYFRRRLFFRYADRLEKEKGKKVYILTAHTIDDALELSLMRIFRGAGPAGLSFMPVRRGRLLRPMLKANRNKVVMYLNHKKITWREDSTNTDKKFLRNKIRGDLIPILDKCFPEWRSGILALSATQSLVAKHFSNSAQKIVTWERSSGGLVTDDENFFSLSKILREEAVFCAIDKLSFQKEKMSADEEFQVNSVKRSVIRRFCSGSASVVDLGALILKRGNGKVALSYKNGDFYEKGFSLLIKEPGLYNLNNISIEMRPNPEGDSSAGGGYVFLVTEKEP